MSLHLVYVSLDMTSATAPGKVILCGEHAVVYGRPALAIPVLQVKAKASLSELMDEENGRILIHAPDIQFTHWLHEIDPDHPLREVIERTLGMIKVQNFPAQRLEIHSTIPIASGMGSSAAISIAIIRALSQHFRSPLPPEKQSQIAFEIEKRYHGMPSGIDNTTIAFERPVFFVQGNQPMPFDIGTSFYLIIANSGIMSSTADAVGKVREGWLKDKAFYENLFDQIGAISRLAQQAIKAGQFSTLGALLNQNQDLLQAMGVSTPQLEKLIHVARDNGAIGAKLSGAGLGGNIIALTTEETSEAILIALQETNATDTILTKVGT